VRRAVRSAQSVQDPNRGETGDQDEQNKAAHELETVEAAVLSGKRSRPGMELSVHSLQTLLIDMRVNLRR
jgi:hypothetical protein